MKIKQVIHYGKYDKDCICDYYDIELFKDNDEIPFITFGDWYHDKGKEKSEGLIMGLKALGFEVDFESVEVADREEY